MSGRLPAGPSERLFGDPQAPLSALSDAALMREVEARRARRAGRAPDTPPDTRGGGAIPGDASPSPEAPEASPRPAEARPLTRQVRQWLANLELGPDATQQDVERAYAALLERYGPAVHDGSADRRATARALLSSLKKAHEGLRLHFSRADR